MDKFKHAVRDLYASALATAGFSRPARWASGNHLILTFHRVLPQQLRGAYPLPGLVVTPDELRWILETLLPDFVCLPVSEAWSRTCRGTATHPLLSVSLDDGQSDNYEYAAPVLAELGVRATFYVPTGAIGGREPLWHDRVGFAWINDKHETLRRLKPYLHLQEPKSLGDCLERLKRLEANDLRLAVRELPGEAPDWAGLMDWDQVLALRDRGHEIGSHASTHRLLSTMTRDEQANEIQESRTVLERRLRDRVTSFCYPNGSFDDNSKELVQAAGFDNAVTTRWGLNGAGDESITLRRCDMDARRLRDRHGLPSESLLQWRLSPYRPSALG